MPKSIRTIILSTALLCLANTSVAREAADYFAGAPESAMPLLSKTARLDMLDYFRSGLSTPTSNQLNGTSRITAMSPQSIDIAISDATSLQIALVPIKNDTLIALIETVSTPIADSSVRFYTSSWEPLKTALPDYTEFIDKKQRKDAAKAEAPMTFTVVRYNPDEHVFIFTDKSKEYYHPSDVPAAVSMMKPEIRMTFDGKKFRPAK